MFDSMKHMMNGAAMKQGAEMMSKMSDEELKQYISMTGMSVDPTLLRSASSNMAKLDESTLENMKNNAPARFPTAAPTPSPISPGSTPELKGPLDLKNQGNDFFKSGSTEEASRKYSEGIEMIEKMPMSREASELEVTLRMNLAACLVKQKKYEEIVSHCKKVLILGENAKAYYRYGQALYFLGDLEKAREHLGKAKRLSPEDNNSNEYIVTSLLQEVTEAAAVKIQDKPKDRGIDIEISQVPEEKKIEIPTKVPEKKPEPQLAKQPKKDKIVEKPEKPEAKVVEIPRPSPQIRPPDNLNLPNLSQDQMSKGLESLKSMTPETISQMANTLKTMDPRLMQSVFKSQGIDMPPEEIAKMADMLTPETVNLMTSSLGGRPNPPPAGGPQPSGPPAGPAGPDISSMLNNPALTRMASEMLGKQLGKKPEDIESLLSCLGKLISFFVKVANFCRIFTAGNRKYFTGAVLILIVANYFGMLG